MLRICSIGFILLLLLDGAASALAKENGEPAHLLADKTTLSVAGNNAACFEYGNGIKFTASYSRSVLFEKAPKSFQFWIDKCLMNFKWSGESLQIEDGKRYYHEEKDVSVEITDHVKMNGEFYGDNSCKKDFNEDSPVNVTITGCSDCQGLKLVFDNEVCRAVTTTKKPSQQRKSDKKQAEESGLGIPLLVLIIVCSTLGLIAIVIGVALFVYLFIMPRCCGSYYSSSSSSSRGRSHRTEGSTRSSMQSVVIASKTKKEQGSQTSKKTPVLKTAIDKSPKKTQKKQQLGQTKKLDQGQHQLSQIKKKHASSPAKKMVE